MGNRADPLGFIETQSITKRPSPVQRISPLSTPVRFGKFGQDILATAVINNTYRPNSADGKQLTATLKEPDAGLRDYRLITWLKNLDFRAHQGPSSQKVVFQAEVHKLCSQLSTVVGKMWARELLEKSTYTYSRTTNALLAPPA